MAGQVAISGRVQTRAAASSGPVDGRAKSIMLTPGALGGCDKDALDTPAASGPAHVELCDSIPLTGTGRLARMQLRQQATEQARKAASPTGASP